MSRLAGKSAIITGGEGSTGMATARARPGPVSNEIARAVVFLAGDDARL
jgi:hypothetical protein